MVYRIINAKTLVVASSDNPLWRSFIPPIDQLPPALAKQIKEVYSTPDGQLSMQPFFDLLALHELGHAFHNQAGLKMQRKLMGELFANSLLHTYIAENEPDQLPALTLFPKMVVAAGVKEYLFTSLSAFEENYERIAKEHSKNYGWYQCRLSVAASDIYDAGGKDVLVKLWTALKANPLPLKDNEFTNILQKEVHPSVSDVFLKW